MKYINNDRKLYINDHNIPVIVKFPLSKTQMKQLDAVFGIGEILDLKENEFKDFVDYNRTRFLNLKQSTQNNENTLDVPSKGEISSILKKKFDKSNYGFWFCDVKTLVKYYSIPERFKNLDVKISPLINCIKVDFKNHSAEAMDKTIVEAGRYYNALNTIDFKFPVFVFDKNEKMKNNEHNTNFLISFYSAFATDSFSYLIHELKHALNRHTMLQLLEYKKISPYDYLKLLKYEEYSAEMEAVFNFIKTREMVKKYITPPDSLRYQNILDYLKANENYYDNFPEFVNFIKKEREENFIGNYDENYYLDLATIQLNQFPYHFANKSYNGVYETLKKSFLSFEIFNPNTKEIELVDLSSYFKDKEITSKEKYILDKNFRKYKKLTKFLENNIKISNKTLKILKTQLTK